MSNPLAATSVAINTCNLADLKSAIARRRAPWLLSAWHTAASILLRFNAAMSSSACCLVLVKTNT